MNRFSIRLLFILMIALLSCDKIGPGTGDPLIPNPNHIGTLDMAFIYRVQGIPPSRLKKVLLCLAYTAEDLYKGIYFIQANVSEAVVHYRFELPKGDYFYYARVICLCGGDSCQYSGFSGQYGTIAAGGKVTVEEDKITSFVTNFH